MGSPEFTDSPRYPELSPDTRQTVRVRLPDQPIPAAANITQQLGWTGGYRIGKRHSAVGEFGYRVPYPESTTPATAADIDRQACAGIQTPWYATCLNDIAPVRPQPRPPLPRPQAPMTSAIPDAAGSGPATAPEPPRPAARTHHRPRLRETAPPYYTANRAPIAQLVELRTFNPQVPGSSPGGGTARAPGSAPGARGVSGGESVPPHPVPRCSAGMPRSPAGFGAGSRGLSSPGRHGARTWAAMGQKWGKLAAARRRSPRGPDDPRTRRAPSGRGHRRGVGDPASPVRAE